MNRRLFVIATAALTLFAGCSSELSTSASTAGETTTPSATAPDAAAPDTAATTTTDAAASTTSAAASTTTLPSADPVTVLPAVEPIGQHLAASITTPDGRVRTYELYVPTTLPAGPVPLVLAFHGGTGWGKQFERTSGLDGVAEANGFLIVFPDGVGTGPQETDRRTWNGGECCGAAARNDVDDVGFVAQLLDTLEQQYDIDPARVFATGHSNGGILSYRLACELSDRIAAVAFQAGTMEIPTCTPSAGVSLLHLHGNADTNLPIDGGVGADSIAGVDFVSPRVAVATYAAAQQCATTPSVATDPTNPDVTVSTWTGCADDTVVEFVEVDGAAHGWMGHRTANPTGTPAYADLDASLVVIEFLLNHPATA